MKYYVSYNDKVKHGEYCSDHVRVFTNSKDMRKFVKNWKKKNPGNYQLSVMKETKRAITQIFGVL